MKTSTIRFSTKNGFAARKDSKIKCENLIDAKTLAKTILSTDRSDVYTYSIEHRGKIHHFGADYHNFLGSNPT